jgi:hypothetical protein
VLIICTPIGLIAGKKQKQISPCDQPREILSNPKLSKEDQKKVRKIKAQGLVNISISEDGDVVETKVVRASSEDAAPLLIQQAKSMKFKPRIGCGTTHTAINFTRIND